MSGTRALILAASLIFTAQPQLVAQTTIPDLPQVRAGTASNRVHWAYLKCGERFAHETTNGGIAVEFAQACFDRADYATNSAERAALAERGIAASRRAILLTPDSAAAHHYLAVNLGQLARTKLFSALGLLDDMEAAWKKSIELDSKFNHACAHRSLGLLYLDAPGWPFSLGSRAKARRHLQKAVELDPDFPDNRLCLLEARFRWGETRAVQGQLAAMEITMQTARAKFTGDDWERDWEDWEVRWKKLKAKASAVANARSPRDAR